MNTFAEKRQARIARLRERAAKKAGEGDAYLARSRRLGDMIPLGQPILVGHHSERHARRDAKRIRDWAGKGVALHREANALERRAEAAESNRAIFTDDPEALNKLRAKLAEIEAFRERARKINRACRSKDPRKALAELGCSEAEIKLYLTPDFCGRIGVADYKLANKGAEARRIQKRIADLEARQAASAKAPEHFGDVEIREEDNRVRVLFPYKPAEEVRALLKRAGFRWSPSAGAWQRHASEAAWAKAREIAREVAR